MALTRKRKREIARLKGRASDLWDDQKDVLDRANQVVREASRHAGAYAREEVAPRAKATFQDRIAPAVASGATQVRDRVTHDVIPAASSAVGSALALLEVAKDQNVQDALKRINAGSDKAAETVGKLSKKASKKAGKLGSQATKAGLKVGKQVGVQPKSSGPGRYILIGIGVVALLGVAYAAWQTLRADDDLWIDDEDVTEPDPEGLPS